jgi:hypothetical protein
MQALEHSSRDTPEGLADPRMLFYRTLIVESPDIADVVKDISFLRRLSLDVDERLRPLLLDRVKGYEYSVASLSSVRGRMLDKLSTTTTAYHYLEKTSGKQKTSLKDIISGQKEVTQE